MDSNRLQPPFAGIPTFFRAPIGTAADLKQGDVAVIGAPFDGSNSLGRPGSRFGPRSVREASCYYSAFYYSMPDRLIVDLDGGVELEIPDPLPLYDLGDADTFPMDVSATTESISNAVASVAARGAFPITIGGDHTVGFPAWKGATEGAIKHTGNRDIRVGVVQVDSHTDLFDDMEYGGRLNYGTFARRISEHANASPAHMAWLGLNGRLVSREQYEFVRQHKLLLVTARELMLDDWEDRVDAVLRHVCECDFVYVTVDIDAVDASQAPGTTAAVFGGIDASRFLRLMEKFAELPKLVGLDLCEVAPNLDPNGRTARLGALALVTFVGAKLFRTRALPDFE